MIELYGMTSPNVFKVSIMLEEVGLPWSLHYMNVFAGEQFTPEFLANSPNGKVPLLIDSQGPAGAEFAAFESGAILLYLAEKTGMLLSMNALERYVQLQWLMVQMSTVGPLLGQYNHFMRYAPAGNDYARERYVSEMLRILTMLETRLAGATYFGGEAYSVADIAMFPWIRNMITFSPAFRDRSVAEQKYSSVLRWYAAVAVRPAVVQGIGKLEIVAASKDKAAGRQASPYDLDRLHGRGKYGPQR